MPIEILFTQAELAEELGYEFVWCGVTSDYRGFPRPGHNLWEKVIYRHTHFQSWLTAEGRAFQSRRYGQVGWRLVRRYQHFQRRVD